MDFRPYLFCLSFYLLFVFLPPFEDNGLLFWVPGVLCRHSEVVLWNLLSTQMFFWWICRGESGLPVLFLCHLRTASRDAGLIPGWGRSSGGVHGNPLQCPCLGNPMDWGEDPSRLYKQGHKESDMTEATLHSHIALFLYYSLCSINTILDQ